MKQIIQIKHNTVNNPSWPEANQFVIYKRDQRFELRATVKQIRIVVRTVLEPRMAEK